VPPATSPNVPPLKDRLKHLLVEYGSLAIWVYFAIFLLVLVGFAIAIQSGVKVESAAGTAGVWGAAWVSTKLTQPLRILATLVVTPFVMRVARRIRGRSHDGDAPRPP
jgi:hypothetical protein